MITKIKLTDFFEYAGLKYNDDGFNYEYEDYSIEDILYNLPAKFKVTDKQLEKHSEIKENLNRALNDANNDSLVNECYSEQNKMVEKFANEMVEYINNIEDEYGKQLTPLNSIVIDWNEEVAIIDFNAKDALSTTREIINGQGQFIYQSDKELAEVHDGKNKQKEAVIQHLHYLLNIKLIDSIYGMQYRPNSEWEVTSWDINQELVEARIEERLTERQLNFATGKLNPNTYNALVLYDKVKGAEDNLKTLRKELYLARQKMPKKDSQLYVDAIA